MAAPAKATITDEKIKPSVKPKMQLQTMIPSATNDATLRMPPKNEKFARVVNAAR